ncbi:hypothetical protein DLAC_06958 [Tieghemostelium lacteum]|uniref:Uncharacterized protein n=1 Tax=Tieghemostelium lacteum TaxID=361077 RepID=A0A151ZDT2_TIELA|nr:hypothetical protein DLAC_06958 [Tieghemostelium lacteum]|eukprot:KYQ92118.1 hypothetical protein DLAC_06958 [Tieghemostelium lacteum]
MIFKRIITQLTPKMGNKNYYKGRGVRNPGITSSKARFSFHQDKMQYINSPDLTDFELKPYVSRNAFPQTLEQVQKKYELKKQNRMKRQEQ